MARALAAHAPVRRGVLATPRLHGDSDIDGFEWFDAAHPLPDIESERAGRAALTLATDCDDLIVLLSGGASALLALPAEGLTLHDKQEATQAMLRGGISIDRVNCVRRHLSAIKGGRLGAVARRSLTLAISDVHGPVPDDPSAIGSGPTVADRTTFGEALTIAAVVPDMPEAIVRHLERGVRGEVPETVKPGDRRLQYARYEILANRQTAVGGARAGAQAAGYGVRIVDAATSGEARDASLRFLADARRLADDGSRPLCVIASGETTVHVKGEGLGGRNQEFVLAAAPHLGRIGRAAVVASAGTDGIDGPTDAAGALVDSSTLDRAVRAGLDWKGALDANDAYRFFAPLGDLIVWGPTRTNVGDVHVMLIA